MPFTRAGCNVGRRLDGEHGAGEHAVDIPKVFGASSPEVAAARRDSDSFKDAETADYVGVAVHCAQGSAFCADAQA